MWFWNRRSRDRVVQTRDSQDLHAADQSPSEKSIEEIRARVEAMLEKGDQLFATKSVNAEPIPQLQLQLLGPELQRFFCKYAAVRSPQGGFEIARSSIAPSQYRQGFVSVGHDEDWDVVIAPGTDTVFVVEGGEPASAQQDPGYPSIYHLLVEIAG